LQEDSSVVDDSTFDHGRQSCITAVFAVFSRWVDDVVAADFVHSVTASVFPESKNNYLHYKTGRMSHEWQQNGWISNACRIVERDAC
jgi:glycosylphosphatidylinositol transamidase (GPIT) subunit GPI8